MSNITPIRNDLADPKRLKLIRDTVAKDCNDAEFNWAIDICRHTRLDPLRRQIYFFVFHKNDPKKRNMVPVTAIGGFRAIAARTGTYRADNRAPRIIYNPDLKDPHLNPLGIERAEVSVFQHAHGEWHEIVGEAYWEEFAPIIDEWIDDRETGERRRSGKRRLDSKKEGWTRMPRVMIAKCAEAIALRKAWPDDFANLYEEAEIDRSQVLDLTPAEYTAQADAEAKLALVGGKDALTVAWDQGGKLERVPLGKFADQALAWAGAKDRTTTELDIWWSNNLPARTEYKAKRGSEYLEWQKAWEANKVRVSQMEIDQTGGEA